MRILNLEMMARPINWVTVGLMVLIATFAVNALARMAANGDTNNG